MSRNILVGLIVVAAVVAGFIYYQDTKDDVSIKLPGNHEINIDN